MTDAAHQDAWTRVGPGRAMSQGTRHGDIVFVSGQVAFGPDGAVVGEGDVTAQAEQCFANIERVLAELGATLADVGRVTAYVTDASYGPAYIDVRERVFGSERAPASSTVVVAALLDPRLLVEVEAIAAVGGEPG